MPPKAPRFPLAEADAVPRVVAEALLHRAELASLEFDEAKGHAGVTATLTALASVLLLLAGFTATLAIAASVWAREDRGIILGSLALAYLVAASALWFLVARRFKTWVAFPDTRDQFHQDCACIHAVATSLRP
jgi:uncharacterized membrane protein YqjE